jgi:nucleotide-binding universal stress UspA family protein
MNTADRLKIVAEAGTTTTFDRVVVGVDGSPESDEAVRQAAVLTQGRLTLLAVYDIAPRIVGGTGAAVPAYYDEDEVRAKAEDALQRARRLAEPLEPTGLLTRGTSWVELIGEIEREEDTLVVVGSHGIGRARGIVVGSTATELVHKAPCSVLVARKASGEFPKRIAVGIDGSPESAVAFATARALRERFDADVRPIVAHGGKRVDEGLAKKIVDRYEDVQEEPVAALVASALEADLLIVGSRGLHGLKSLGSVSERVAHQAGCSVLLVREPPWQRVSEALAR